MLKPLFVLVDFVGWNLLFSKRSGNRTIKQCWKDFNKYAYKGINMKKILIVICFFFLLLPITSFSAEIIYVYNKIELWKGLIAENASEGYLGLKVAALVYRNRLEKGMPLGCISIKRKDLDEFVKAEGLEMALLSKRVLKEVFEEYCEDITGGATHYENVEAFGKPYWEKDMIILGKIGSHTLYKRK